MVDQKEYVRQFFVSHKSWYADALGDRDPEIMFGLYSIGDGTIGEMAIRWHNISDGVLYPRLEAFSDSWHVLSTFGDLLAAMAEMDDTDPSPERVAELLLALGFQDATKYERPKRSQNNESLEKLARLEREISMLRRELGIG